MKTNYIILFFCLLVFYSCSKDQTNYELSEVNKLTVVDTADINITEKQIDIKFGDTITVELLAKGTISGFDPSKVNYTWVVGNDTIGSGNKVDLTSDMFKGGPNVILIKALDYLTNLEYLYTIDVNVSRAINKGLFVLAEDKDRNAILYMKSSQSANSEIIALTKLGIDDEYPLGKDPLSVEVLYASPRYPSFLITSKSGDYPWMLVDLPSLAPTRTIGKTNAGLNGKDLQPTFFKNFWNDRNGSGYMVEQGKVRYINSGALNGNAYAGTEDFNFGKGNIAFTNFNDNKGLGVVGFEENSKRILVLPFNGSTRYVFPNAPANLATDPIPDAQFWGAGSDYDWGTSYAILLKKGNRIYNYQTSNEFNWSTYKYEWTKINLTSEGDIPNADKAVGIKLNRWDGYFYYAIGRTIYRFPFMSVSPVAYFTLPEDGSGDIVAWSFDKDESSVNGSLNIGIATYNPNSSETKKGSLYHYAIKADASGNPLTLVSKDLFKIEKAVSMDLGVK